MNLECKPVWHCKQLWLDVSEVFDAWRVIPRIMISAYGVLCGWTFPYMVFWYAHLPAAERTTQVTAFVGTVLTALTGMSGYIFKVYTDGGREWDPHRQGAAVTATAVVETK